MQIFTVHSHPWTKHGASYSTFLNATMKAMWKVVHHYEFGEGYQFNPYDQAMPNITIGKDRRWIIFKALNGMKRLQMIVHNQFDLQDAVILYSIEKFKQRGEMKYVHTHYT